MFADSFTFFAITLHYFPFYLLVLPERATGRLLKGQGGNLYWKERKETEANELSGNEKSIYDDRGKKGGIKQIIQRSEDSYGWKDGKKGQWRAGGDGRKVDAVYKERKETEKVQEIGKHRRE